MSDDKQLFLNRELSWLEFNDRVLGEARDASLPLLERLKFLAIVSSNLDEFFKVRVGGLHMLVARGSTRTDPSGLDPTVQLREIGRRVRRMVEDQMNCYRDEVEPGLAEAGLRRALPEKLSEKQLAFVRELFESEILPVLTPLRVPHDGEFPFLLHPSLNVGVRLKAAAGEDPALLRVAMIPFGAYPLRFITLPSDGGYDYILLEDLVRMFVDRFFTGETVVETVPFRVTRNADVSLQEDQAADLLSEMEDLLEERKESDAVRLEIGNESSALLEHFLRERLSLSDDDVYRIAGPLDLAAHWELVSLSGFETLHVESWPPQPSPDVDPTVSMFEVLAERDVLLSHPFESFDPVVRFIEEAANDPDVLSIKQTLYRTSRNSPIVAALMRAAKNGKYVTAVVELKARFDEARNIVWARNLEHAGAQVIYGVKGLKVHAKVCIVTRREPQGIRRYVHFGTGNYNEVTSRLYCDVSLLTCDPELAADATSFLYAITGYSQPFTYNRLDAAPTTLRSKILELIDGETERKIQGQRAEISCKLNSLVDSEIIKALYRASQAGVKVRLNVRGICCLRPGVPGLSENIEVVSIVDRFLEHARILHFHHGGDERVFISSADWMPRNLDRRLELLIPVTHPGCRDRLIEMLKIYFRDNVKTHVLKPDGTYRRLKPKKRGSVRSQEVLYHQAVDAGQRAAQTSPTVFVPHLAHGADD